MNELSGKKITESESDMIRIGFCPNCGCSDSKVERTKNADCSTIRVYSGEKRRVSVRKIIRYRRCEHCGKSFRTTEESSV